MHLNEAEALRAAEEIDGDRAAGRPLGPLAGVPLAIKDVLCTRGLTTECGSRILEGFIPPFDATCVARLSPSAPIIAM